ncbi:MAG: hypothetical protein ABFC98_03655 [Candidatus Cloacimonas sp.]
MIAKYGKAEGREKKIGQTEENDYTIYVKHLERLPAEKDVNWSDSRQC